MRATYQEANKNVWVVDAEGLIAQGRKTISDAQQPFVRSDLPNGLKLKEIVDKVASADHQSAAVRVAYFA
jgi:malic enzyme